MSVRAATIIIGLLLVALIAFLLFNFISAFFRNEKLLTVKDGPIFESTEIRVDNGATVKIKNQDSVRHEIVTEDTNKTLVTVEEGKTSDKLDLEDDTIYDLVLAEDSTAKTKLIVGTPEEEPTPTETDLSAISTPTPTLTITPTVTTTPTPISTPTPTRESTSSATGRPLPNTGPEDDLKIFLLMILGGFFALKVSKKLA